MSARITVPVAALHAAIRDIFTAVGLSGRAAGIVAESLTDADRRGISSHGAMLVPMYVERIGQGSVSLRESADVVVDTGAVAVLDAGHALGQLSADQAMALTMDKARRHGVGVTVVRHAFHFGGAFRYVQSAAAAGFIGVAAANTRPLMPAPGGARAVVGNNPLAIGVPIPGRFPLVLDMALSEAALGKIRLAAQAGRSIPATWATDQAGAPTTDAVAALAGMLLPMAGPKGYGLALAVDILTGVLSGGCFGSRVRGLYADVSVPNDCAHFFLALDIGAFGNEIEFARRVGELAAEIAESPLAPGADRVLLPGQLEAERHVAAEHAGVDLDESVLTALHTTAAGVGITLDALVPAAREGVHR